jgi:hypothetical protein
MHFLLLHSVYIPSLSHPPQFDHPNTIYWKVLVLRLIIVHVPVYQRARHHNPWEGSSECPLGEPQISQSKLLPVTEPWSCSCYPLKQPLLNYMWNSFHVAQKLSTISILVFLALCYAATILDQHLNRLFIFSVDNNCNIKTVAEVLLRAWHTTSLFCVHFMHLVQIKHSIFSTEAIISTQLGLILYSTLVITRVSALCFDSQVLLLSADALHSCVLSNSRSILPLFP